MTKRIAIFMPGGVGGGYYSQGIPVIAKLVDDLSAEYDVSVYSLYSPNADFKPNGFQLVYINNSIKWGWIRWSLLSLLFLKHHFKKRYDVLYAFWGLPAGVLVTLLSKIIRKPSTIHLQGGDAVYIPSVNYGSLNGFKKRIMIWAYNHCSVLIALTHFQKDKLVEAGVTRSVEVIPFGPDLKLFQKKKDSNIHSPIRVLHVGNLLPVKDQIALLNAFALIAESCPAEMRIIGEDHLHGLIHNRCKELNIQDKVEFLQIQPYNEMPLHYTWADLLLITSVYEGQCLAVSEAAASGVVLAGTRVGMLSDWSNRCAIVSEPGNAERLANEIINTLNDISKVQKLIDSAWLEVSSKDRRWTFLKISDCINRAMNQPLQ